uniref:Uncharacterized protein n=1 Tax=Meloidogyne enterolobii TaxID=390850 RepID=A0A6V7WN15_MELEN|nr:unnamed protein product [Meloidogyne enterolobii]
MSVKPQNCPNYSLYYFEIKCKFVQELYICKARMTINLKNCTTNKYIRYIANSAVIIHENAQSFTLSPVSFNNNDIFGCGLVYPPFNMNRSPYVFFTQNGKQIGKCLLLKDNPASYKAFVDVTCCSVKANFGNDLEDKPFKYDISKHSMQGCYGNLFYKFCCIDLPVLFFIILFGLKFK